MIQEAIATLENGYRYFPDDKEIFRSLLQFYHYIGAKEKVQALAEAWKARHPGEELPAIRNLPLPDSTHRISTQ